MGLPNLNKNSQILPTSSFRILFGLPLGFILKPVVFSINHCHLS